MPAYVIGNFLLYCMINAFTPGPGNILALNTVNSYGWKGANPCSSVFSRGITLFRLSVPCSYTESARSYRVR